MDTNELIAQIEKLVPTYEALIANFNINTSTKEDAIVVLDAAKDMRNKLYQYNNMDIDADPADKKHLLKQLKIMDGYIDKEVGLIT